MAQRREFGCSTSVDSPRGELELVRFVSIGEIGSLNFLPLSFYWLVSIVSDLTSVLNLELTWLNQSNCGEISELSSQN